MNQDEDLASAVRRGAYRHCALYTVVPARREDFDYCFRLSPASATVYVNITWTHRQSECELVVRGNEPFDMFLDQEDTVLLEIVQHLPPDILHATNVFIEEGSTLLAVAKGWTSAGVGSRWDADGDELSDFFCLHLKEGRMEVIGRTL